MSRMNNDIAALPFHMRAVFYRQFARDAEHLAHQSESPEKQSSCRELARQWRALAAQLDAECSA